MLFAASVKPLGDQLEKPFIMPYVACQGFLLRFATSLASGRTNFLSGSGHRFQRPMLPREINAPFS
jgi:hypothetical protein